MILKYVNHFSKLYPQSKEATSYENYVEIGSKYIPFGILFWENYISFAVLLKNGVSIPVFLPEDQFEIIDNRISENFVIGKYDTFNGLRPFLSYPEWANDISYTNRLIDGEHKAIEAFEKYKKIFA